MPDIGIKHDEGKPEWSLLPFDQVKEIVKVLTASQSKYVPDNWKEVDDPIKRYKDALFRHLDDYMEGEYLDSEYGLSHLAHAGCNLLFLMWHEKRRQKQAVNMGTIDG